MNKEPNYFAVIPAEVRYANIRSNAKLLYGELTALTSKEGYCWASDNYFASLYGLSRQTVNQLFRELKEKGFIIVETTKDKTGTSRKIFLAPVSKKSKLGVSQKPDTNNTSINNTNNTINKLIGETTYGNADINTVMDDLYTGIGLKPVNVKVQRIAASNLIKRHGLENTRKLIKIALQLQETDRYASRITSMQDLWNKQNNILVSIKKNHDNQNNNQIRSV